MNEKITQKTFTVPGELEGRRLDYLIALFNTLPRKIAREIVENGLVLVNGTRITFPSKKLKKGDRIVILEVAKGAPLGEPEIIYEDTEVVVVNKPPGFLTEKSGTEKGRTLKEFLEMQGKSIYPVHRLDRETSGVVLFGQTIQARDFLMTEFKMRRVYKTYLAVIEGRLKAKSGVIKGLLQRTGEYAETYYEVMKELNGATLLKLKPKTGRTHQLRIQLAQLGHPIIGDKKYYNLEKTKIFFTRQALHAYKLSFTHPRTKTWMHFTAPIPEDLKELISRLSR
ncbi:MAG: RluA family pseudouridine synthase [candidate division WOR-3 bacterium]